MSIWQWLKCVLWHQDHEWHLIQNEVTKQLETKEKSASIKACKRCGTEAYIILIDTPVPDPDYPGYMRTNFQRVYFK